MGPHRCVGLELEFCSRFEFSQWNVGRKLLSLLQGKYYSEVVEVISTYLSIQFKIILYLLLSFYILLLSSFSPIHVPIKFFLNPAYILTDGSQVFISIF